MQTKIQGVEGQGAEGLDLLNQAFEAFSTASGRLEKYYRDLEERVRELKEEKEEIKNFLGAILQSVTTGVIVTDLCGRVTMFNPAAGRLTGCSETSVIGKNLEEMLEAIGLPGCLRVEEVLSGQSVSIPEVPYPQMRGDIECLSFSASAVRGAQGQLLGAVLLIQDVTELKKLEEQLGRHHRLAAMGEMAVKIAHEIRNPLGSIELLTSVLKKELAVDEDKANLVSHILSGVRTLAHVLSNLLIFTRSPKPVFRMTNVCQVLQETLSFTDPLLKEHQVELATEIHTSGVRIHCDRELIKQVFLNLILNAVQAMPGGGRLRISVSESPAGSFSSKSLLLHGRRQGLERGGRGVEIVFSDTGMGIPKENLSRIFDPFFTTKEKGTGLGLAIVHNILEAHGATVEVESTPGQGSSFTLHFRGRP